MSSPEQHDDHIWLTVGGSAWAIERIEGHYISFWRGYWPDLEYLVVDISDVDWEEYHRKWEEITYHDQSSPV